TSCVIYRDPSRSAITALSHVTAHARAASSEHERSIQARRPGAARDFGAGGAHMNAYAFTRLIHVLVAVLGIGLITAGAILTRPSTGLAPIAIRSLARWASAAMLVMFVSGMLLDYFSAGAFHHATWFRLAIAASIAAGVVVGYARRAIGQAIAGKS